MEEMNELDAMRYRRLATLIKTGEWSISKFDSVNRFWIDEDIYMDDKEVLDSHLDAMGDYK
jgi:hypothetical protein